MKIGCPQCGAQFAVPEKMLGRPIRCGACRFNFKANPEFEVKTNVDANMGAGFSQPSQVSIDFYDDETSDTPVSIEGILSEDEVDGFISNLKSTRTTRQKTEDESKDQEIILPATSTEPIDIDEDSVEERKRIKEEKAKRAAEKENLPASNLMEELDSLNDSPNPSLPPETPEAEKASSYQSNFVHEPAWKAAIQNKRVLTIGGLGLLLLIALSFTLAGILFPEEKVEASDPFLSQLLQESGSPKRLEDVVDSEPVNRVKVAKPKAMKSLAVKKNPAPRRSQKAPGIRSQLLAATYSGNFSKVISIAQKTKKLGLESRALFYEAHFLDPKQSPQSRIQALKNLDREIERQPSSSLLVRAKSASYLGSRKTLPLAIQRLQGLLLTRARDPLVYAYLGLAYYQLGRAQLALSSWNQALTLEPGLSWIAKQKDQLVQKMVTENR